MQPVAVAVHAARAGYRGTDLVTAVAVAYAESGGNDKRAGGLWGLPGVPGGDPAGNAAAAYARWKAGGWKQWKGYTSNRHLLFIPVATVAAASAEVKRIVTDPAGTIGNAVGDLSKALPGDPIGALQSSVGLAYKAGAWIANRHNWTRVAQVIVGSGLILASVSIMARPAITAGIGGVAGIVTKGVLKGVKP